MQYILYVIYFICTNIKNFGYDRCNCGIKTAEEKQAKMAQWIEKQQLEKFALRGIILAPGARMENEKNRTKNPKIIAGKEALRYLGYGLEQIYDWFIAFDDVFLDPFNALQVMK